ncbi:MAG TPA: DUF2721 domain-containing protein [Candidatus Acidoferrales bacterium]|nr:DUF2721 domain-containing protein [Candidatus Acidoferrales bacterium]
MGSNPLIDPDMSMVSAMITPAILILAAGSLVASTLVRLGRVVDQTRAYIARGEQLRAEGKVLDAALIEQRMSRQLHRAELARNALWGYYIAIALFLLSSVVLALGQATHSHFAWVGPVLVLFGGLVLMIATLFLVAEVGLSAGSLREEVNDYEKRVLRS